MSEETRMNPFRRTMLKGAGMAAGVLAGAHPLAFAQAYPSKPVRIVVPYPPGGPTDIVARLIGNKLEERFKQPFVIDNKPGAGGNLGAEAVARAAPDGYSLVVGTTAHAINPSLFKQMNYDLLRDLTPVALLTRVPLVLVVHPSVPARTVEEFIAHARKSDGALAYASSGNGQSTHLAAELFKSMTGVKMTHVPYKGSAPALVDVAGGQVAAMFDTMLSAMPQVKAGRLRALAVTSERRSGAAPELPTIAESGVPGYEATAWNGLLAPAGTPKDIVEQLNKAVNELLAQPDVAQRLVADGADPGTGSVADFDKFIRVELDKWARVVKSSGAVMN
jgi:tripartite-type tricarboxylate transporter receptor subunit TctC